MLSQYRNKIIALFISVCLLATFLCVPAGAVSSSDTMLYNGVELPNIESVWPDEETYPYAVIHTADIYSSKLGSFRPVAFLAFSPSPLFAYSDNSFLAYNVDVTYISYSLYLDTWDGISGWGYLGAFNENAGSSIISFGSNTSISRNVQLIWSNHDIFDGDGFVYFSASSPVDPGPFLVIETFHIGDDFVSTSVSLSGLESTDSIYNLQVNLVADGEIISSTVTDAFAGSFAYLHITKPNLTPETEYTLEYVLLENGEETSVTVSETFTTLAAEADDPVDDTDSLSLLSAILSAINDQNDRQEREHESFIDVLTSLWLRLRYIETLAGNIWDSVKALAPSAEETALKEAAKETTQAVTDSLYADDAPTKVTVDDVKDVAQIGSAASKMFNPGVGVGAFFDAFNDISLVSLFTEGAKNDIYAVNEVSTYSIDGGNQLVDYYSENLNKIKNFVGGDG